MKIKILLFALFVSSGYLCAAELPKDSIFILNPNWEKGEQLEYKITTTKTNYFNSDSTEKKNDYKIKIKVKEKNISGYILEVPGEKSNDLPRSEKIPASISAKIDSLISNVPIIYKTDTNGVFIDILNQYQLKNISKQLAEIVFSNLDTVTNPTLKASLQKIKETTPNLVSFYEQFKSVLSLIHYTMGSELKLDELYSNEIGLPNPITGATIPGYQEFRLYDYSAEDSSVSLEIAQEFEPRACSELIKGTVEKMIGTKLPLDSINYPDSVFIVKYFDFDINLKTKWPNKITAETMIDFQIGAERTFLEIELLEDKRTKKN